MMLDGHGKPTTDFKTFRGPPRGVFLPFGGYKGSGVALITEILGGLLSGNGLGKTLVEQRRPRRQRSVSSGFRRRRIPGAR